MALGISDYIDPLMPNYYRVAAERAGQELITWNCMYCPHINMVMADDTLVSCRSCGKNGILKDGVLQSQGGMPSSQKVSADSDYFISIANKFGG